MLATLENLIYIVDSSRILVYKKRRRVTYVYFFTQIVAQRVCRFLGCLFHTSASTFYPKQINQFDGTCASLYIYPRVYRVYRYMMKHNSKDEEESSRNDDREPEERRRLRARETLMVGRVFLSLFLS